MPVYPDKSQRQDGVDLLQSVLNALAGRWFTLMGWLAEVKIEDLVHTSLSDNGRIDFCRVLPDGRVIAVEIQLGNSSYIPRDFEKMAALHKAGILAMGYHISMTKRTAATSDTGQANYETVCRRVRHLPEDMPICILGVDRESSEEVDLSKVKGLVFPQILGGSGVDTKPLLELLARAILDRKDLTALTLPPEMRAVVRAHANEQVDKDIKVFLATMVRSLNCKDPELCAELVTKYAALAHSTELAVAEKKKQHRLRILRAQRDTPPGAPCQAGDEKAPVEAEAQKAPQEQAAHPAPVTQFDNKLAGPTPGAKVQRAPVIAVKQRQTLFVPVSRKPVPPFALAQKLAAAGLR